MVALTIHALIPTSTPFLRRTTTLETISRDRSEKPQAGLVEKRAAETQPRRLQSFCATIGLRSVSRPRDPAWKVSAQVLKSNPSARQ